MKVYDAHPFPAAIAAVMGFQSLQIKSQALIEGKQEEIL
jgi:hypothetical protein